MSAYRTQRMVAASRSWGASEKNDLMHREKKV